MANDEWTVDDIADALRVTPGRVRQIIGADRSFPRPRGGFARARGRTWESSAVREWAAAHGRKVHTADDDAGTQRWAPGPVRPTYDGYRMVLGHDVLTYTGSSQRIALAQRRDPWAQPPTPDRLDVDVVVTWGPWDFGGEYVTADGAVGKVRRQDVAGWLGDTGGPATVPWWTRAAVTPTMLRTWRPGDPPLPVTAAAPVDDPAWRLLGDADPLVVSFGRCALTEHPERRESLGDGRSVLPPHAEAVHVLPEVDGVDPIAAVEATEKDYARAHQGALNLLSRRDEVAMHPDLARLAAAEALTSASHPKDSLTADEVNEIVAQWTPTPATAAHVAFLTNFVDDDDRAEFYIDPFDDTPCLATSTRLVVSSYKGGALAHPVTISTVEHPGAGETAVVTDTHGRLHLPPIHVTYGYRGTGPLNFAWWLASIIRRDDLTDPLDGPRISDTMLAQHLSETSADEPLGLTGEEVTYLLSQPRTDDLG